MTKCVTFVQAYFRDIYSGHFPIFVQIENREDLMKEGRDKGEKKKKEKMDKRHVKILL